MGLHKSCSSEGKKQKFLQLQEIWYYPTRDRTFKIGYMQDWTCPRLYAMAIISQTNQGWKWNTYLGDICFHEIQVLVSRLPWMVWGGPWEVEHVVFVHHSLNASSNQGQYPRRPIILPSSCGQHWAVHSPSLLLKSPPKSSNSLRS